MDGITARGRVLPAALLLTSALALMAAGPGSALAGTASVQGNVVHYDGALGEANHVEIVEDRQAGLTTFLIRDTAPLVFGAGCAFKAVTVAECRVDTFTNGSAKLELDLGNANDSVVPDFISLATGLDPVDSPMKIDGGPGVDTLQGSSVGDTINGGDGDDNLFGNDGSDVINGNIGADEIDGGAGNDTESGGIGEDILDGFAGADTLFGNDGDDKVRGGVDNDRLEGNSGNDTVVGGPGLDKMFGGTEADTMNSSDGGDADTVDCGGNLFAKDNADIDASDTAIACENVF
jgi:RTX calcium-binding nonapeptide repeat (4 copies)